MIPIDINQHPSLQEQPDAQPGSAELQSLKTELENLLHDLNNPLCVIAMSLSRIENSAHFSADPDLVLSYEEIDSSLDRIKALVIKLQQRLVE